VRETAKGEDMAECGGAVRPGRKIALCLARR
jgi:hypothetical protein